MILEVTLDERTYPLATNLMVAYELEEQNNHKPYATIFSELGQATLPKQIELVYTAFKVANREDAKTINKKKFTEMFLMSNENTISALAELMKGVVEGIAGKPLEVDEDEDEDEDKNTEDEEEEKKA